MIDKVKLLLVTIPNKIKGENPLIEMGLFPCK
jgi:hypothetical protein